jgi:hypothetical protein
MKPTSRKRTAGNVERGTIEQATAIIGLPIRTVQEMAARAEIPGAAKFGRRWTFDIAKLRRFVELREQKVCLDAAQWRRPVATGIAAYSMHVIGPPAVRRADSPSPYTQTIRALRGSALKPGRKP